MVHLLAGLWLPFHACVQDQGKGAAHASRIVCYVVNEVVFLVVNQSGHVFSSTRHCMRQSVPNPGAATLSLINQQCAPATSS
jgi:hypothetical protein